ncbi:MAG: hypothetical protein QOJ16_4373 [Acidobacteriota bacterium]|nr:hypothetical protein [Acidobacteriota bacterium]
MDAGGAPDWAAMRAQLTVRLRLIRVECLKVARRTDKEGHAVISFEPRTGGATWSAGVVPPEVRVVVGFLPDPLAPTGS